MAEADAESSAAVAGSSGAGVAFDQLRPRPWTRYWARWLDLGLFGLTVGIALWSVEIPAWAWAIGLSFSWALVEAILLATWGWTPAKWLLRIAVRQEDGRAIPTFRQAIGRSLHVWVSGAGFGIPIVALVVMIKAHGKLQKEGITSWDRIQKLRVLQGTPGYLRGGAAAILVAGIFSLVLYGKVSDRAATPTVSADVQEQAPPGPAEQPVKSKFAQLADEEMAPLQADPKFRAWAKSLDHRFATLGYPRQRASQEGRKEGALLASRGLRRLPDDRLRMRAELFNKILVGAQSEADCAAAANGQFSEELLVTSLAEPALRAWIRLGADAMLAEVYQVVPPGTITEKEAEQVMVAIYKRIPRQSQARFSGAVTDLSKSTEADACWAARVLYREALELPERLRTKAARVFVAD